MREIIQCIIYHGEKYYIAECLDFPITTQGKSIDEAVANIREAVFLHLEDENLEDYGFIAHPKIEIRIEAEELSYAT